MGQTRLDALLVLSLKAGAGGGTFYNAGVKPAASFLCLLFLLPLMLTIFLFFVDIFCFRNTKLKCKGAGACNLVQVGSRVLNTAQLPKLRIFLLQIHQQVPAPIKVRACLSLDILSVFLAHPTSCSNIQSRLEDGRRSDHSEGDDEGLLELNSNSVCSSMFAKPCDC